MEGDEMGGDAFLVILVAAVALFLGGRLEKARRAGRDAQALARRLAGTRAIRTREYVNSYLIIGGVLAVLVLLARG
jgi:hypothetical protein